MKKLILSALALIGGASAYASDPCELVFCSKYYELEGYEVWVRCYSDRAQCYEEQCEIAPFYLRETACINAKHHRDMVSEYLKMMDLQLEISENLNKLGSVNGNR